MSKDSSAKTSKEDPSQQNTSLVEERWAERMKPSRQRKLTQSQRNSLAASLKWSRRLRFLEDRLGRSLTFAERMDPNTISSLTETCRQKQETV